MHRSRAYHCVFVIVFAVTGAKTDAATGFGLGIDFTGGTEMTVMIEDNTKNEHDVLEILKEKGINNVDYIQGVTTGGQNGIRVQYKNVNSDATKMKEINDSAKAALESKFGVKVDYTNRSSTASADLVKKAFLSVGIALILILVYIIIRFEWLSGVAAVLALLHDVFIMVCLTVICRIPINSSFIAAVITVVAYSINNTIIVFDRVRERKKQFDKKQNHLQRRCGRSGRNDFQPYDVHVAYDAYYGHYAYGSRRCFDAPLYASDFVRFACRYVLVDVPCGAVVGCDAERYFEVSRKTICKI